MEQFNNSSYLFTGQELDDELDLYNYNARLYNPRTGAFISADSVGGANRYAYANNNPMAFADPSGNSVWDVVKDIWETIKVAYGSMLAEQILYSAGDYKAYETLSNEYREEKSAVIAGELAVLNLYYSIPAITSYLQSVKNYRWAGKEWERAQLKMAQDYIDDLRLNGVPVNIGSEEMDTILQETMDRGIIASHPLEWTRGMVSTTGDERQIFLRELVSQDDVQAFFHEVGHIDLENKYLYEGAKSFGPPTLRKVAVDAYARLFAAQFLPESEYLKTAETIRGDMCEAGFAFKGFASDRSSDLDTLWEFIKNPTVSSWYTYKFR